MALISRGFRGRRDSAKTDRLPPGQYETRDFPVLSAGPTPRTPLAQWALTLRSVDGRSATWNWQEFSALPKTQLKTDIHCVTKWSKFDTSWEGVSIDTLLEEAGRRGVEPAPFVMAVCDGGYTTNIPLAAHPEGCAYRARMIQSLDAAQIRWRVAYTGSGISGLQNAVINGLGVSALTRYTMLPGMRVLDETDGFPPLAEIRVGLFYKHPRLSDAGIRLVNHIIARLDEAGVSGDPMRGHAELDRQ